MPCTIMSLGLVQITAGKAVVVEEVRTGAALGEHLGGDLVRVRMVVTPGRIAARVASCISATTLPALRILFSSSVERLTPGLARGPAFMISSVTSSGLWSPSTVTSSPRDS